MNVYYQKLIRQFSFLIIFILSFIVLVEKASAQPSTTIQTGRYGTVDNGIPKDQWDLLSPMIQIHFLPDVKTIGDAIQEILRYSGYSLVETQQQSQDLQNTLQKILPLVQRDIGPMPLRQSLKILIGPAFHLLVDPLNRTINFQLNTNLQLMAD